MFRRLKSLQVRVPLSLVAVTLLTFLFLSLVVGVQTRINLESDQKRSLQAQAHALAPLLTDALLHDDVWTAYTALHGPRGGIAGYKEAERAPFRLVLDGRGRVFVSDRPRWFPLASRPDDQPPGHSLASLLPKRPPAKPRFFSHDGRQLYLMPLLAEETPVGTLLVAGPRGAVQHRLMEILASALLGMLALLLVITPLGWVWGSRMVQPLVRLADCMRRLGKAPLDELQCPVPGGDDEIGQLAHRFSEMLHELRNKRALERQMVTQDRLAAIGRIAGGVAHEINNPLAGMLVAIDTYRQSPEGKRNPDRTLALVERGLQQIRETVSALLVECRMEKRRFSPDDIEDIERLVLADRAASAVETHWHSGIGDELPLPANAVRQILLNLALNAVQAAAESPDGQVEVEIQADDGNLRIAVRNTGAPIDPAELERIFEPFHTRKSGGSGLGLWITYQIVSQLHGEIAARSEGGWTLFLVTLPLLHGETA